jgi:hypothetical protein
MRLRAVFRGGGCVEESRISAIRGLYVRNWTPFRPMIFRSLVRAFACLLSASPVKLPTHAV